MFASLPRASENPTCTTSVLRKRLPITHSSETRFAVLDFGSQYTQLIARRLRELGVYSEIFPFDVSLERLSEFSPKGVILSGGPSSVYEAGAPLRDVKTLAGRWPLLGICYGMQLIAKDLGGEVVGSHHREYGLNSVTWSEGIVSGLRKHQVWMSHGDVVKKVPPGFQEAAVSGTGHMAAMKSDRIWALQFHPEVAHTERGEDILKSFCFDLCKGKADWSAPGIVEHLQEGVLKKIGSKDHVLCALSGGVDSTVTGTLLTKTLGAERVHCVFVNNGLLRKNEFDEVLTIYKRLGLNIEGVDAENEFLTALKSVSDPEQKRKIIGRVFIEVFDRAVHGLAKDIKWLAQGTLYPDVIESVSPRGTSVTIKSHHNVGGLPAHMKMGLVEPLRELFKDEVRRIGKHIGIPADILGRHPFPGPGLAVRVLGEITKPDLDVLRDCDAVYVRELKKAGLYDKIWQAFVVLLPVRTVGVQGDGRTYGRAVAIRAVTSTDGMTADWFPFPVEFLRTLSNAITNEVRAVNRVVLDVTSKPPGTIEWE